MNLSGQLIIKRIQRALEKSREEAVQIEKTLREEEVRKQELLKKHGDTLLLLSQHYLPELSRTAIEKLFEEAQSNLLAIIERKERRAKQIQDRHTRLLASHQKVTTSKERLIQEQHNTEAELQQKEENVTEALKANKTFQKLSQTALHAEEQLTRNEESLKAIKKDNKAKLPDYKNSSLFQYLLKRDYGTKKYSCTGLTRRWDQWTARQIDFGELKQSYLFLTTTQKLMKEEIKRRKADFDDLMEQIENFQKLEADNQHISKTIAEIDAFNEQIDGTNQELERLAEDIDSLNKELIEFEQSQDDFYKEALSKLTSALSNTQHDVLEARAKKTEEQKDDHIVDDLGWISDLLAQQEEKLSSCLSEKERSAQHLKTLEFALRRSSQTQMGTERGEFPAEFDVKELIRQSQHGVLDKDAFWKQLQEKLILKPNWASTAADGVSEVLNSSSSRMIGKALTDLASSALQEAARRGLLRRQ